MSLMERAGQVPQRFIGVRCVDQKLVDELDRLAVKHQRSRSWEVRRLLREGVRRELEREGAA